MSDSNINFIKKHVIRCIILFVVFIFLTSCNDKFDRKINNHFSKFILKENLKDYEIENIKRRIVTIGFNDYQEVKSQIVSEQFELNEMYRDINTIQSEIQQLKNGKTFYYEGIPYYSPTSPVQSLGNMVVHVANPSLLDYRKVGKEQMIKNKQEVILQRYGVAEYLNSDIENLKKKLDSIQTNPNEKPLWIYSYVTVKGTEISGVKKLKFQVIQYLNGDIKDLKSY